VAVTDNYAAGGAWTAAGADSMAQAINGSGWLQPCQFATVGTETFTIISGDVTQINGTTIDGGTPAVGARILIKDAPGSTGTGVALSTQPSNGVYTVTSNATNIGLSRVYEMSNTPPTVYLPVGLVVDVMGGTVNGNLIFNVIYPRTLAAFVYGTGSIRWGPVNYVPGTGLVASGSTLALTSSAQTNLALAANSLQSATGVLGLSGSSVVVSSMSTGQVILGNGGVPAIATVSGDVALGATGVATIQSGAVTLSKMADLATGNVLGNVSGSTGAPTAVPVTPGVTALAIAIRDNLANLSANAYISSVSQWITAGGTTTLDSFSTGFQQFIGTATQTCVLPAANALSGGIEYSITNRSSAAVTVQTNGGATLQVLPPGSQCALTLIDGSTSAGIWDVAYTISGLTAVSVATANGFGGTSSGGATPALTLTTSVTGLLKGNGTGVSAAVSGTDYAPATTGTSILKASSGGFANAVSGTDYAPATVTTSALKGNGSGGFSAATLNDLGTPTANWNIGGTYTITGLPTPVNASDVAIKSYVDALVQGVSNKYSAEAATVGTETFTIASGSVTQISGTSIDGVSPNVNDYILIKDAPAATGAGSANSTQPGNGLYQVTGNTTNLSLSRATDMSGTNGPVGAFVFVAGGTVNGGNGWIVTTPSTSGSFTYGTNNIHWTQFSGAGEITAGTGLSKSGNTLGIENSGVLLPAHGGTGSASITGLVKGNGTSAYTAAVSGTDYAPPTSGSSILKGNGAGGFSNAASGTDYAPATSGSSLLKGNGAGGFSSAVSGTDYAPATTGTSALAANGSGGFTTATLANLGAPAASLSMNGYGITSVANPVNAQDAATKIYVDSAAHPACRAATTGTETFTISSGTVTQIAGTSVDGVSPSVNDRILIKDAPSTTGTGSVLSSQPGNGIYIVTGNTTNLTVSRVSDTSSGGSSSTPAGSKVLIEAGSANASTEWVVSSPSSAAAFTYGTTAIQWTPGINVGNVLARSGNTISVGSMSTGQAIVGNAGTPSIATLSGDVTLGATGAVTIAAAAVSLSKMANLAASSVVGNSSGSAATPAAISMTTAATAGALALRDTNANLTANAFIDSMNTTATAAGTTTLTVASAPFQQFTGTSTQTCVMPAAATLVNGTTFTVANRSTGAVTVESNGGASLQVVASGQMALFTLISNSGSAGTWDVEYFGAGGGGAGSPTPTANTGAEWDASLNLSANAFIPGFTTTATAAGTTTLTITSDAVQVFTGASTQTVKLPTTGIVAGAQYTAINQSTGNITVQSSGANTIIVLRPGQSALLQALVATPTTAAGWLATQYAVSNDYVWLDSFAGSDDTKLTAAMAYAQAQSQIPAIQFSARSYSFAVSGRTPYNSMRLLGAPGGEGPKNMELSSSFAPTVVTLSVGNDTSAWFNGGSATVYDVTIRNIAFQDGSSTSQFWAQAAGTLYACEFNSLTFYGFQHVFGSHANKCLMTQVMFTGQWQVIAGSGTQFHIGGSDCCFWMSGYCNFGMGGSVGADTYGVIFDTLGKTSVGYLYITNLGGWSGMLCEGGGSGVNFHGGTYEGLSAGSPATAPPVTITGGDWAFFGSAFDFTTTANGIIVQSGGTVSLHGVSNNPATTSPSPLIYQTGGVAYYDSVQGAGGTTPQARWSDGNVVSLGFGSGTSNAPSPGSTTITTAAATTTLTVTSTATQVLTGTTTQTVQLPTTSVPAGAQWMVVNKSSGAVTVRSSAANTICVLVGGTTAIFTANIATPTTAANWNCQYGGLSVASGKLLTANNSLTLNGTDGTTFTLPGANDTLAGIAVTQTLTNKTLSTGCSVPTSALALSGAATAYVGTLQSTTATTLTDLATVGPAVTVTIGASGMALVICSAVCYATTDQSGSMNFAVSGATTIAAPASNVYVLGQFAVGSSAATLVTGLTPGSNTFTAKYQASGGTAYFEDRGIIVIPL